MNETNDKRFSINPGILSLITFFTVLLLTVFAVLVVSSARSDMNLTQKAADSVTQHYAADNLAEEKLAQLYNIWQENSGDDLYAELEANKFTVLEGESEEGITVEYAVPIVGERNLYAKILINEDGTLKRLEWRTGVDEVEAGTITIE